MWFSAGLSAVSLELEEEAEGMAQRVLTPKLPASVLERRDHSLCSVEPRCDGMHGAS
jgi:hypothetical protein